MAIYFELVVNFGDNIQAARDAAAESIRWVLRAGDHRVPLHRSMPRTVGAYTQLSIVPVAVGWGVPADRGLPKLELTGAELTDLGHQLYALLAKFDGYVAAQVGWEPEAFVDPAELKAEWSEELVEGSLHGLVVSDTLHGELGLGDAYVPFQPGYRWIPYRGEMPSGPMAD
ncbi:hypothetical protein ACIRNI_03600 [Streptomyces sp. NPDC093546]|uniref:hypothetical protein n=1 Tax=Streptomyces sp. NPDC093546 TaxID=3366040 RepID=UPI0037FD735F